MAGEQDTNSQDPNAKVEAGLFKMFGGGEPAAAQPSSKPRDESGKFVRTGQPENPAQAEEPGTEQLEPTEGQELAQDAEVQSEEVEVEIEGEKYLVPKKISDRFIQHADYTRKTQDVAEMRRALSAEREASNLERAFGQSVTAEFRQMALLDAQIEQYKGVNWGAIEDTGQLIKLREQLNQLKEQRASIEETVKAKRSQFDERIKGVTQEARAAGMKYIEQHIKDYGETTQKAIFDYGRSEGYTQEELGRIIDPRIVVTLWKASQWDALKASQPGITKRAASAAPVVRPGASQKPVSRVQSLQKAINEAKTPRAKQQATEDYLAHRLGGGR